VARGLLPATVPHADAAADAGKAALLVAALAGRPDQLWRATRDYLHQDYRRPAMAASLQLVDRLRSDGHAAVVSGAGPSVLVLVPDGGDLAAYCPEGWRHLRLAVDTGGAVVG
jgi:homoserine kinase